MKKFIRLVNFEFERFSKFLFVLLGILVSSQVLGNIAHAYSYMRSVNERMPIMQNNPELVMDAIGPYSVINFTQSFWFEAPIVLCIISLLFYTFFIWYREWLAKNTFAYRLLMLPMNRITLLFAKLTVLILGIFTILAVQLGLLIALDFISSSLVASKFFVSLPITATIEANMLLFTFLPTNGVQFLLTYLVGFACIMVTFTSILIERSFRRRGALLGLFYGGLYGSLMLLSLTINSWFPFQVEFYTSETIQLALGFSILFTLLSYWLSHRLLHNQITI